jgi:hypothetical protein
LKIFALAENDRYFVKRARRKFVRHLLKIFEFAASSPHVVDSLIGKFVDFGWGKSGNFDIFVWLSIKKFVCDLAVGPQFYCVNR